MPKKKGEKVPPPGTSKDPTTNFFSRRKWRAALLAPSLELQGRNIIPRGALIIGTALMKTRHVCRLDMSHNCIDDEGAVAMADMLRKNESIQHLNLAYNGITDVGGIALASAFIPYVHPNGQPGQWNRTLFTIILRNNKLGDATLLAFSKAAACHRDLSTVDLSWNDIGPLGTKCLMRSMQRNPLCTYMLMGNRIGDEGTIYLCEAMQRYAGKGITSLNLYHNDVRHKGVKAVGHLLENNEFILDVSLHGNTIGQKGMQEFSQHFLAAPNTVRHLNIANCMLGDSGAIEVAAILAASPPALERLNIAENNITDDGGAAIARALLKNNSLISLNCSGNTFGPKTTEVILELIPEAKVLKLVDMTSSVDSMELRRSLAFIVSDADGARVEVGDVQEESMEELLQHISSHMQLILSTEAERAKNKRLKRKAKVL